MAVGAIIFVSFGTITVVACCTLLLRIYAHESVPWHAKLVTWLSWSLSMLLVVFLPMDLSPSATDASSRQYFYVAVYWFCFVVTWVVSPAQAAYVTSGSFTVKQKFMDIIKFNIILIAASVICGVIGFFYLVFATHFQPSRILAIAQAFGNLWGLTFAIVTAGYGLIEIPRYFWHRSNYDKRLQYLYFVMYRCQEEREFSRDRVDELLYLYQKLKRKYGSDAFAEYAVLDALIPAELIDKAVHHPDITFDDISDAIEMPIDDSHPFTLKHLRKMHYLFKVWLFEHERSCKWWIRTMADIFTFEDMLETKYNNHNTNQPSPQNINNNNLNINHHTNNESMSSPKMIQIGSNDRNNSHSSSARHGLLYRLWFKFKLFALPYIQKGFAIFLAAFTLIIIWSEFALSFAPQLSIFALVTKNSQSDNGVVMFAMIGFSYMTAASLFALWRIHFNRDYHMHPYQLTDSQSILTNSSFAMRFMFPLGYNFLLINDVRSDPDYAQHYPYVHLFHDMSTIPLLGDPINTFLPLLLVIFCLATFFNLFAKILKCLRISRFEFSDPKRDDEVAQFVKEGQSIVRKFKLQLNANHSLRSQFEADLGQFLTQSLFFKLHKDSGHSYSVGKSWTPTAKAALDKESEEQQKSLIFNDQFGRTNTNTNPITDTNRQTTNVELVGHASDGLHNVSLSD